MHVSYETPSAARRNEGRRAELPSLPQRIRSRRFCCQYRHLVELVNRDTYEAVLLQNKDPEITHAATCGYLGTENWVPLLRLGHTVQL
jgi:hypothetical protein